MTLYPTMETYDGCVRVYQKEEYLNHIEVISLQSRTQALRRITMRAKRKGLDRYLIEDNFEEVMLCSYFPGIYAKQ
jgi:hypothetical protein